MPGRKSVTIAALVILTAVLVNAGRAQSSDDGWTTFTPGDDEFSIQIPSEMKETGAAGPAFARSYRCQVLGTYYFVFSDPASGPYWASEVAKFATSSGQKLDAFDKKTARQQVSFQDRFGYWNDIVLIRAANRVYVAQAVREDENDSAARRFVDSFKLRSDMTKTAERPAKKPLSKVEPAIVSDPVEIALPPPSTRSDTGSGGGMGSGYGEGRGSGTSSSTGYGQGSGNGYTNPITPPPKPAGPTLGVKIISMPRPSYTDVARIYGISGLVTLRVTFLANGKIGTITATKKLPFGLTDKAIEAARQLQFQPAQINGVPMTAAKQIQYNFDIY